MKEYYLNLTGLSAVLRTPHEITISQRLAPFVCPPDMAPDCTIELRSCAVLPAFSESGVWHGAEFFDTCRGQMRIFHCHSGGGEAFAVTRHFENGNVEISVLPEYMSYFTGSGGIFNRIGMETLLLQHKGLLLHASLIEYNGRAIAFAGPSGVGKSTQAEIWRSSLGARVINGDRAVLRKTQNGWQAFGSPYAGTSGVYKNENAPLAAVIVLSQAKENRLRRLNPMEALGCLYPEVSIHRWDRTFVDKAADLCLELLADVPVYALECLPEESAALTVKKGLSL